MALRNRFCRERWNLGVVPQSVTDIAQQGIVSDIQWFRDLSPWEFLADPACFMMDGKLVLLAERLNYWHERGEIWASVIDLGRAVSAMSLARRIAAAQFRPWLRTNFHLSYPFPFYCDNTLYMICESWEASGVFLWRKGKTWELIDNILDKPAVDATIWQGADRWWLFCGLVDDQPNARLHIYHALRPEGPWHAHKGNPVKTDVASSRPAGPLFYHGRMLIRPTQNCVQDYGHAITLNIVETLNEQAFSEYPLRQLPPSPGRYSDGLHTICSAGDVAIIDGRQWDTFQPLDVARKLIVPVRKRLRRLATPHWSQPLEEDFS